MASPGRPPRSRVSGPTDLFVAGIGHDLNNLLTGIGGLAGLLLVTLQLDDRERELLAAIVEAAEEAGHLAGQLESADDLSILAPERRDVPTIVRDAERHLRPLLGERVEFLIRHEGQGGRVSAARGQIEQILLNLVSNARDAMPQGGTLRVRTARLERPDPRLRHSENAPNSSVLIEVSDTGVGIVPENMERIFEPFFTTKEPGKGTGLGLATVQRIALQLGGSVEVASTPGEGTTFSVYLPAA